MAIATKIEWCDHTFNPWYGCTKVSPGCDHCYAENITKRFKMAGWGPDANRVIAKDEKWQEPLDWDRKAWQAGESRRVFCASMSDVFDNQGTRDARDRLWETIKATPNLDWLLLTKRPQNIQRYLPQGYPDDFTNVWLGVSAENQTEWNRRLPILMETPATIHFVSYEPALGPIDFMWTRVRPDWVIAGGESGPGARALDPLWIKNVKRQCDYEGIAFFMKQWGRYQNNPLVLNQGWTPRAARDLDPPGNGKGGAFIGNSLYRDFPLERRANSGLYQSKMLEY